jgi:hypothetical protein
MHDIIPVHSNTYAIAIVDKADGQKLVDHAAHPRVAALLAAYRARKSRRAADPPLPTPIHSVTQVPGEAAASENSSLPTVIIPLTPTAVVAVPNLQRPCQPHLRTQWQTLQPIFTISPLLPWP